MPDRTNISNTSSEGFQSDAIFDLFIFFGVCSFVFGCPLFSETIFFSVSSSTRPFTLRSINKLINSFSSQKFNSFSRDSSLHFCESTFVMYSNNTALLRPNVSATSRLNFNSIDITFLL